MDNIFHNSFHAFFHNYSLDYKKPTQKPGSSKHFLEELVNKWQYEIEIEDL